jgi:hypothetical protein
MLRKCPVPVFNYGRQSKILAYKNSGPSDDELLAILLERKLLSGAQVEVAKIDSASSGLSYADVLLARKWLTEETLAELYSKTNPTGQHYDKTPAEEKTEVTYQQNLQKYLQLMTRILGENY